MDTAHKIQERILRKIVEQFQDDHDYFLKHRLLNAERSGHKSLGIVDSQKKGPSLQSSTSEQLISGPSPVPENLLVDDSPFGSMKGIQTREQGAGSFVKRKQDMFKTPAPSKNAGAPLGTSTLYSQYTPYNPKVTTPAMYRSYATVRQNVLVESSNTLLYHPYFHDDQHDDETFKEFLAGELRQFYNVVGAERQTLIDRTEQAWQFRAYTEKFLDEIGCKMSDVICYLLLPENDPAVEGDGAAVRKGMEPIRGTINRAEKKWTTVLARLRPGLTSDGLIQAKIACRIFHKVCQFSIWNVAMLSELLETPVVDAVIPSSFEYADTACRVCYIHNCPFHGEVQEEASDDDAPVFNLGPPLNIKKHVTAPPHRPDDAEDVAVPTRKKAYYWRTKTDTHEITERPPFFPCSHEGSCETARCRCFRDRVTCEKSCGCLVSCERRFRGCSCAAKGGACWEKDHCQCFNLDRECDPDLCGKCGAAEVLDPGNRYDDDIASTRCANVSIQKNVPRRTLLGQSQARGFGLYMGEDVKKGEYIGEYKGEIVTDQEAERRGTICYYTKLNYLFGINKTQAIDGLKVGNKMRFINNSTKNANVQAKTVLCNTVTRIGMYAGRDIKEGEELFFNYNWEEELIADFVELPKKSPKAAKQPDVAGKRNRKITKKLYRRTHANNEDSDSNQNGRLSPAKRDDDDDDDAPDGNDSPGPIGTARLNGTPSVNNTPKLNGTPSRKGSGIATRASSQQAPAAAPRWRKASKSTSSGHNSNKKRKVDQPGDTEKAREERDGSWDAWLKQHPVPQEDEEEDHEYAPSSPEGRARVEVGGVRTRSRKRKAPGGGK